MVALDQLTTRQNIKKTTAIGRNNPNDQKNWYMQCQQTKRSLGNMRNAVTEFCCGKTVLPHCPHFAIKEK